MGGLFMLVAIRPERTLLSSRCSAVSYEVMYESLYSFGLSNACVANNVNHGSMMSLMDFVYDHNHDDDDDSGGNNDYVNFLVWIHFQHVINSVYQYMPP